MSLEDPRKRAAEEKKVRIDHSDVYLENEKLAEALDSDLDTLARRRHRQAINRDHEIRLLRQSLGSMGITKTRSASLGSLRPHSTTTTNTTTTTPAFRRLKPPPNIVRLDVHVPNNNHNHSEDDDDDDHASDVFDDDSSEEGRRGGRRRVGPGPLQRRTSRLAWGEARDREDALHSRRGSTRQDLQRITKEQMMLNNLDMEAIPPAWFTEVHHPSDVLVRRRASSAHPSSRPSLPTTNTTTTPIRRPKSETQTLRPRRVKSALVPAGNTDSCGMVAEDVHTGISLFCGGGGGGSGGGGGGGHQKSETMRSRRQLMELAGGGKPSGPSEADVSRHKFLEVVRLERERLEARVKMFLRSCDTVGEGGIGSRKEREYHNIILPHTLYG